MTRSHRSWLIAVVFCLAVSTQADRANAQNAVTDFDSWASDAYSKRFDQQVDAIATAVGTRSTTNQVETDASVDNSTTLVDTSSVADVVSVALNLADLTGSTEDSSNEATTTSGTVTSYAIYTAVTGKDPLDPETYCASKMSLLRRFSATLGNEQGTDGQDNAILAGARINLSPTDICTAAENPKLDGALRAAAGDLAKLASLVQKQAAADLGIQGTATDSPEEVLTLMLDPGDPSYDEQVRKEVESRFERALDERIDPVHDLAGAVLQEVQDLEKGNRYGLVFLTKQRGTGADEYSIRLVYERLQLFKVPELSFTINGGWSLTKASGQADDNAGDLALAFGWQPKIRTLEGRRPINLSLATDMKWAAEAADTYRGQAKVVIPVFDGVELPISVTVANRTELIDETDVRGLMGFTFDTTRLMAAFR